MGSIKTTRTSERCTRYGLLFLFMICSTLASAQFTITNSSFSNGKGTGTDGTYTVTSLVGSFASLTTPVDSLDAPTGPASGIIFTDVLSHSMTVSFTPGNGDRRLAVMKAGSASTFVPADHNVYSGELGGGTVAVFDGTESSFDLDGLLPDVQYFITIFEYNIEDPEIKYLVAGAPTASQFTLALPNVNVTTPINGTTGLNANLNVTTKSLAGATIYTIEISTSPEFTEPKVRSGTALTYNFDSLQYNTLYYARVKTDLRVEYGKVTTFSTRTAESLARVTSPLDGAVDVNTALNIMSNTVLYASEYRIQLSTTPDFSVIAFDVTGSTPTLAFSGLSYSTLYYNRVLTDLTANYGQVGTFTTKSASSITFVSSPANGSTNIATSRTISANDFPGATSYTIQLSETPDFAIVAFEQTGPTRTLNFSGLKYNTLYYNRVSTDLSGGFGLVYSFTTRTAESISYVVNPSPGAVDRNVSLTISANIVPGATSYTIQLSTTPDFAAIAFEVTGATNSLAFSGLAYATTYYNRVRTNYTPTTYGAVYSFTTKTAESLAYVIGPADGAVNKPLALDISATIVPGATSYTIQLSTTPDFAAIAFQNTGPTRILPFAGLAYSTTYYNRVSVDGGGFGPVKSFTTLTPESIAFVTVPANNATGVSVNPAVKSSLVPGAATYTIQLSLTSNFAVVAHELTSPSRTQNFTGLIAGTQYFNRVRTNLTANFGAVGNFTTAGSPPGRLRAPVGVEETELPVAEFNVQVYPNPFREKLEVYIESTDGEAELALTDMSGRSVHRSQEKTNTLISIEKPMAAGVYLLQVRTEHHSKVLRVVKLE
jgi:hypothetical protein